MDSLLKQMETEAEAQEILGSINDAKEEIEKDDTLSVQEKVMKILELTSSEIIKAKLNVQKIRAEMEDSLKAMEMQSELQSGKNQSKFNALYNSKIFIFKVMSTFRDFSFLQKYIILLDFIYHKTMNQTNY